MKVTPEKVIQLDIQEVNELRKKIKSHPVYNELITDMKQIKNFEEADGKVQVAHRFEMNEGSGFTSREVLILSFNTENDVLLSYSDNLLEGALKLEDKLLRFSAIPEDVVVSSTTFDGDLDIDYSIPEGKGSEVESQAVNVFEGEGCYPSPTGHYEHCGKNCGYYGDLGGGTPKNDLDRCCVAHDRCWRQFGTNDPECDRIFVNCANNHYWTNPVLVQLIRWIFG